MNIGNIVNYRYHSPIVDGLLQIKHVVNYQLDTFFYIVKNLFKTYVIISKIS